MPGFYAACFYARPNELLCLHMLKQRYRLKSKKLFRRTLDSQRLCDNALFVVYALKHRNPTQYAHVPPRFGFIVSKKIHKRAVRRNKLRRRLMESLRQEIIARFPERLKGYCAIIFIARPKLLEAPYSRIVKQMRLCFGCAEPSV